MIQQYSAVLITAREELDKLKKEYQVKFDIARAKVAKAEHELLLATSVYQHDKILIAIDCVDFFGMSHYGKGDTVATVQKLIDDLSKETHKFDREYYYCKDYEHWSLQGGTCVYGMGPSHGHVVFEIGKKRGVGQLTAVQIDAILYVLYNLKDEAFVKLVFYGRG